MFRQAVFGLLLAGVVLGVGGLYYWLAQKYPPEPPHIEIKKNFSSTKKYVCAEDFMGGKGAVLEAPDAFSFTLKTAADSVARPLEIVQHYRDEHRYQVRLPGDTALYTLEQADDDYLLRPAGNAAVYRFAAEE